MTYKELGEAFNRTIVELKPIRHIKLYQIIRTFNRTIVELKPITQIWRKDDKRTFNRTIVELKQRRDRNTRNR